MHQDVHNAQCTLKEWDTRGASDRTARFSELLGLALSQQKMYLQLKEEKI